MATTPDEVVDERRGVTGQQAALVLIGLVVLAGLMWFFFLRGSPEDTTALTPPVASPAPASSPTEDPASQPRRGPLETFEVFAPKDPFKPLISQSSGATGAPVAPTTDGTGGTTTGADPGTAPSGGSDIGGDTGGTGGDSGSQDVGGRRVRLIDTFRAGGEARARVQVDGTVYTVGEGDRFAENFELVSISGDCVSILYGDDQFSLCEGEEILK